MLDHSVDTGTRPLSKEGDATRVSSKETEDEVKEECVIYFYLLIVNMFNFNFNFSHSSHVHLNLNVSTPLYPSMSNFSHRRQVEAPLFPVTRYV